MPAGSEDDGDPLESIGDEDEASSAPKSAALAPVLAHLPTREREIPTDAFEEELPQTQIAERVGLSQMHVSRLIRKALATMRDELD